MTATLRSVRVALLGLALAATCAIAQTSPPSAPAANPPAAGPGTGATDARVESFAWLAGCWRGTVNKREFREHWMPLRGHLMIGSSETTLDGKSVEYEYLRIEPREDGVYYVAMPARQKPESFRLEEFRREGDDTIATFSNPAVEFPTRIVYRRGTMGWLYAHVEGKVGGAERQVIYPMRRIDCESGELIEK